MSRATATPTKRQQPMPYPSLPARGPATPPHVRHLELWMRTRAELEAFDAYLLGLKSYPKMPAALQMGLMRGYVAIEQAEKQELCHLRDAGGLLLAWHGTTALQGATKHPTAALAIH